MNEGINDDIIKLGVFFTYIFFSAKKTLLNTDYPSQYHHRPTLSNFIPLLQCI